MFKFSFSKFWRTFETLDQNFRPKYLKQFRPSLILGLSVIKLNLFENLVMCECTELASVNLLCSTSNPVKIYTSTYKHANYTHHIILKQRVLFGSRQTHAKHIWLLFFAYEQFVSINSSNTTPTIYTILNVLITQTKAYTFKYNCVQIIPKF